MDSLGGKEEKERECSAPNLTETPGGFTRLTDKIPAPGFKIPRIQSSLEEQIYISLTYNRKQDEFTWKRKCISSKSHGNLMDSLRREIQ